MVFRMAPSAVRGIHENQIENFSLTGKPTDCLIHRPVNHSHPVLNTAPFDIGPD